MITRKVLSNPFNNNNNINNNNSLNNNNNNYKRKRSINDVLRIIVCISISISTITISSIISVHQQETKHATTATTTTIVTSKQQQQDDTTQRKLQQQQQQQQSSKGTIAYATVLTDCVKGLQMNVPFQILESAAVLTYSVHQNSIRNNYNTTTTNSKNSSQYDYEFYLIYHPEAKSCVNDFKQFGFILIERTFPVQIEKMKSKLLRTKIQSNGCCGERELIKLEAYTLVQHPLVVLFDLDVLLLKPLDTLFDFMLYNVPLPNDHMLYPINEQYKIGSQIDILYTVDYGMANYPDKPVQGGFVVLRPNQTVYNDYVQIVQDGDFRDDGGWGGKSGRFWGAMTFQGLTPYYWISLYPNRSVELNWCYYDNMNTKSIKHVGDDSSNNTICTVPDIYPCSDCSKLLKDDIYLFHYTVCQKPWTCQIRHVEYPLCTIMHAEWFTVRSQLEQSWGRSGVGNGKHYNGYCTGTGHDHYIPIQQPFFTS